MDVLELPGWRIEFDREATAAAYACAAIRATEPCSCAPCRNWAATRERFLPGEFLALLSRLGIPFDQDAEVYRNGRLESGLHLYGAWYHFIGRVVFGEKECSPNVVYDPVSLYFCSSESLLPEPFEGQPIVQLEIEAKVPWMTEIPEEG